MNNTRKFFTLSIDPDSGYHGFDDIVESAMDDPKFAKVYPVITNQRLLEELIRFIELPPRKIKGVGIASGEIFKKENGRQVSGSHRYLGVLEPDGTYNLYKKFKGGPFDGQTWLILRTQDESYQTTKFILEYAKMVGDMPRIRDVESHFSREKTLICRDRIQIILNHCHDAVSIVSKRTNVDYDVTKLSSSIPQQENRNPSSNITVSDTKVQKPKTSQSSSDDVRLDVFRKKPLNESAKPIISDPMILEPKVTPVKIPLQRQMEMMKPRTPMIHRLRKRKATSPIRTNDENLKTASSESSGCATSSMVSKRQRK